MKISPVTSYKNQSLDFSQKHKSTNNIQHATFSKQNIGESKKATNLNLMNSNYGRAMVNFKAGTTLPVELANKLPLEDRLASIFQEFKLGDLILIGDNLQKCVKAMYKSVNQVQNAIKRGFFIPELGLAGAALGFVKNPSGVTEVINLHDKPIPLYSEKREYQLKPYESCYVVEGDVIGVGDEHSEGLKIKSEPKANLSLIRRTFSESFDYESDVKKHLDELNHKTLSQLIVKDKKGKAKVTFADVGGLSELKSALKKDIIYPIKYPEAYENMETNHGFILYGPPGTGKTHIARALSNEAGADFLSINGLDLSTKWVGETEKNWRELFQALKENQPSILFIDEFDAIARSRDSHDDYGNNVVNQLLTLMTDIDNSNDRVYVVAATNNYGKLDSAVTRSGRFGKHYEVTPPDFEGLKEIFKVHAKGKPVDEKVDVEGMLTKLHKYNVTGADIRFIVNDAHNNGYVRSGIFEKMDNGTFTEEDLKEFKITQDDFDKSVNDFLKDKKDKTRKPIGFKR